MDNYDLFLESLETDNDRKRIDPTDSERYEEEARYSEERQREQDDIMEGIMMEEYYGSYS